MWRSCSFLGGVVLAVLAWSIPAVGEMVPPIKEWKGSVEDVALLKDTPTVIADSKALEKLWKDWKVADKPSDIDFTKELVVITTSRGSQLRLLANLDEGNLQVSGLGTRDLRPGFRYVIATVSRKGVKTVNGKELPKS